MVHTGFITRVIATTALIAAVSGVISFRFHPLLAQDNGRAKPCGNGSIQGDWAVTVSGARVAGPAGPETFISVAVRTYDGKGGFVEDARTHGTATGATAARVAGTYTVNPDCTGTARFFPSGSPVAIDSAFIIVDRIGEIHEVVLSPQPNMVTAVQRRLN